MSITPTENYASGRKGAAGEMIVSADLLHRGYEVWRAVSGQAACDLVTEIDGTLYKVEVRSVARAWDGSVNSPGAVDHKGHHILAVVDRETASVRYLPGTEDLHLDLIDHLPFPPLTPAQRGAQAVRYFRKLTEVVSALRTQTHKLDTVDRQQMRSEIDGLVNSLEALALRCEQ